MKQAKPSNSNSLLWVVGGGTAVLLLIVIIIAGVLLLPKKQVESAAVTAVPTAAAAVIIPTIPPTVTPTPLPASIVVSKPADGDTFNLGQPVEFIVSAVDPEGIRLISIFSNGQNVGLVQGTGADVLELHQEWTPDYGGTHAISIVATSRTGEPIAAEPITLKIIDQAMIERNAPIWAKVEANVTDLRNLEPLEPIEPTLMSRTELRQRLRADSFLSEEEAYQDVLVLNAFDFVTRDFDLYSLSRRYLGDSIAGFYDPDTKEFVVVSDDDDTNALEQWTYAHEFMHAMQDQHFQLGLITDANAGFESNMALRALAEGEAELVQAYYMDWGYFSDEEKIDIFNRTSHFYQFVSDPGYFPDALVNAFYFPYTTGHDFAKTLFIRSGWDGLNDAWDNLPQSTEQILHPDRYFAGDAPQIVTLPPLTDTLGSGWSLVEEGVLGEFYLREYLVQELDEDDVNAAALGWGGDLYAVYWHEERDNLAMVLRGAWDSSFDAGQFMDAYQRYADRRYGPTDTTQPDGTVCWQRYDVTCLSRWGDETLVVKAPDVETAAALIAAIFPDEN